MRLFNRRSNAMVFHTSPGCFVPKEHPLYPVRSLPGVAKNAMWCLGIIAVALASVCLAAVSITVHAGVIPYSFIGPHEYQLPVSNDKVNELKTRLIALLEQHDKAFTAQDLEGVMKTYVVSPEISLMGTGPGEIYVGKEEVEGAYRRIFTRFDKGSPSFTYGMVSAGSSGDTAWFAAECTATGKVKDELKVIRYNLSGTMLKQNGEWFFVAVHFSR